MPEDKISPEQLKAELFVDIVETLYSHSGEAITPQLISDIGRVVLEKELYSDYENRDVPPMDYYSEIVGVAEAADILGVSRQRASQLHKEGKMPPMVARLRSTPVWLKSHLEAFHQTRQT